MISDVRGASLTTTDGPVGVRQFCFTCHTTSDTGKGWNSATATYTVPASGDTVVGLDRNGPVLMLKANINAHAQAKTSSCYDCHGSDYGTAAGNNVHNPGPGGGGTSHAFTSGSDAVAAGDAGCTNSGLGCHGADGTRVSFAVYHPNSGCTSGTCHASPSKAGYAANGDCQTCHDGSFVGAPAREPLRHPALQRDDAHGNRSDRRHHFRGHCFRSLHRLPQPGSCERPQRAWSPSTRTSPRYWALRTERQSAALSVTTTLATTAMPKFSRAGAPIHAQTATPSPARHLSTACPRRPASPRIRPPPAAARGRVATRPPTSMRSTRTLPDAT